MCPYSALQLLYYFFLKWSLLKIHKCSNKMALVEHCMDTLVYPSLVWKSIKLYIEIQDQVKKWRPNSWNVTHSYRWLFSNKFFIFAFFVEISTATPHQHPCRTFVLVFGMTLEIKNLRKTIFEFYQFPVKIILVGLCLKALNSIEKLHHPS